jgi:hypothetical protein
MFNRKSKDFLNPLVYPFIITGGGEKNFLRQEIRAVSQLIDGLIQFNLWNKFIAVYPLVGRSSISTGTNLILPGKYRISWGGDITYNSFGVTSNGGYGLTGIPLTLFSQYQNVHIAAYNRTNIASVSDDGRMVGVNTLEIEKNIEEMGAFELNFGNNNGIIGYVYNKINNMGGFGMLRQEMINKNITGKGFFIGNNTSKCYLNGQIFGEWFPLLPTEIHPKNDKTIAVFGNRFSPQITSAAKINLSFISLGYGFNELDIMNYTNIVENFQKAMSRSAL